MGKKWHFYNSPLMKVLRWVTDLVILNLCFVVGSLPILTLGASLTAMYTVTMQMVRGEEPSVFKNYVIAYKKNFKNATIVWSVILIALIAVGFDVYLLRQNLVTGAVTTMLQVLIGIICCFGLTVLIYLFPYLSRFVKTPKESVRDSLTISIMNLPFTLILVGLTVAFSLFFWYYTTVFTYLSFILFALLAYWQSIFLVRVFRQYEK